jgi:hypothetical protein
VPFTKVLSLKTQGPQKSLTGRTLAMPIFCSQKNNLDSFIFLEEFNFNVQKKNLYEVEFKGMTFFFQKVIRRKNAKD